MAIHWNPRASRFIDDSGRFVSTTRALKSSIARAEFETWSHRSISPPSLKHPVIQQKYYDYATEYQILDLEQEKWDYVDVESLEDMLKDIDPMSLEQYLEYIAEEIMEAEDEY